MRYYVLATDYDGTIAKKGAVSDATRQSLAKLRESGRKVILATGRELDDLILAYGSVDEFDFIVAENGAVLYDPMTRHTDLAAGRPDPEFIEALIRKNVRPLSVGHVIIATNEPHHMTVLETIREMGLELQVIFNKGAVMVLPGGINKASGLMAALRKMKISFHNVVGVGDAENDHAFLEKCECSAAVANALGSVKKTADIVTFLDHGEGVAELIDWILATDLSELGPRLARHNLEIGTGSHGNAISLAPYGENVLLAGPSGVGKSMLATRFFEELLSHQYQAVIIDPEGDYANLDQAAVLGTADTPPEMVEILRLCQDPYHHLVVNMVGLSLSDRPGHFEELLPHILEMRRRLGHPHWIIIDETHHVIPVSRASSTELLPEDLSGFMFITVEPDHISSSLLPRISIFLAIGKELQTIIEKVGNITGIDPPRLDRNDLASPAIMWTLKDGVATGFTPGIPSIEKQRHILKYAKGDLPSQSSFYFKGPENKLNIRVQNLMLFLQIAEGIDEETWLYHLRSGDYSRWFREGIKDNELAEKTQQIEMLRGISPSESFRLIKGIIEERYTLPP